MKRRLSSKESERQWKVLLQQVPNQHNNCTRKMNGGHSAAKEVEGVAAADPFDCQDITIPATHTLVERVVSKAVSQWEALDDRKIARPKRKATRGPQSHLKLPRNFDYTGTGPPPPENIDSSKTNTEQDKDDHHQQVISLLDPSKRLSYASELHKLFAEVPTAEELERQARSGSKCSNTIQVCKQMRSNRMGDGISLARLRRSDRHGLPPPSNNDNETKQQQQQVTSSSWTSTIRLECWKRQLKKGSSPDAARMVLEFLASQTLWDVHLALGQLLEDDFWEYDKPTRPIDKSDTNADDATTHMEEEDGCFFIENTLYKTTGTVDYAAPIVEWIDGASSHMRPNPARRGYLGLSMEETTIKPMKEAVLGDIPIRLGFRYYHVCHGDAETALFFTDRRVIRQSQSQRQQYPLLHDVWTPPYPLPFCDACRSYTSMFVTSADCELTNGGPRQLCEHCCRQLGLGKEQVKLFTTWRNEADLSASANTDTKSF